MPKIRFWKGYESLIVKHFEDDSNFDFSKLITLGKSVFLLDKSHQIWQGTIDPDYNLKLNRTNILATDIGATNLHLYYVTESGRVFRLTPSLESCEEIILYEEASSCVHGYATSSRRINVKQISSGGMGVIFISDAGELWASGNHPQLGIETDYEPKKVPFFEGRHVTLVSSGENFNVIVSHKRDDICSMNQNENGVHEVFISNCPQCTNDSALSPLSLQSYSENCPLGLQYKKSCESLSASTSTSKNNEVSDDKRSNNTSSCSEDSAHISDITECHLTRSIEEEARNNEEKNDKVSSMLLINTEAARQFLTKQLSWVSTGGEELLAEVSGPTRIFKQNVTTVASLVYEGVKTVGDKVATLSRHVSGGSDNNSDSFEEFEELNHSNPSLNNSLRWDWSYSEGSDDGGIEKGTYSRTKGARLIRGEVWVWGNCQIGTQGNNDLAKKNKPILVSSVSHIGVCGVWCGQHHCLIQTLDGRVFGWGLNTTGQLAACEDATVLNTPVLCGRAMSVAAGDNHSILIDRSGTILMLNKNMEKVKENQTSDWNKGLNPLKVLSSGDVTCIVYSNHPTKETTLDSDIAHEQCFLEELLSVHSTIVKPLSRKSCLDECLSNLCSRYTDLLHVTSLIVSALLQRRPSHEVLTSHQDELLYVYESYLFMVCDVIATNGFSHIPRNVETPSKLTAYFSDRLPTRKTSPEAIVTCAFFQPLSHIAVYKGMVSRGRGDSLSRWENLLDLIEVKKKEAEATKNFWESAGRISEILRTPKRRIVKESRSSPITLQNASRFSSHWFILMSDSFVHVSGGSHTVHNLHTLWVELVNNDSDSSQNCLVITTPEETLTLTTSNHLEKTEWYHAFQSTIKKLLNKSTVPIARSASYTFLKNSYKDAKYTGRWLSGKMEGNGKLEWPNSRVYTGQFHNNSCHGFGRLEIPGVSVFEGQWKDGTQNGHGITRYETGDVYNGYYKDGLENGHGVRKTGRFTSSQEASVYVGEWLLGMRHGYGVLNSIGTGEKYMGCWSGNTKNGSGLIVTLDGIYYEGTFSQDVLTGHGIMMFEDGTHYEGELKEPGVFGGKGVLTFPNGDYFVGSLHGTWSDEVKISGSLHKHFPPSSPEQSFAKPKSFGDFCVSADLKWKAIFRQCWGLLGSGGEGKGLDTQRAWENVAITLGSRQLSRHHELLQTTPVFGRTSLDLLSYQQIKEYLLQAFESGHHPLGRALSELVEAYTTTYSGVVHPLLLSQAVSELHSITQRLYHLVRLLFPALPEHSNQIFLDDHPQNIVCMSTILHPIILPKVYSSLLVLYSLHNKNEDETYWKRLLKWNRQPNTTLMAFLGIDKKFWKEEMFSGAVETLQLLKTTFSPMEKLIVLQNTFQEITLAVQGELGDGFIWTMDDLFPVFHYIVVRAHIQGLGSEVHYIEDFMEPMIKQGELGIMFTTLKACFFQILQEKVNVVV